MITRRAIFRKNAFSLIELLVVVTIIAILAAIGITAFGGFTSNARDAKRKADVDAIAKAYEKNYDSLSGVYETIGDEDFTSKKKPTPPEGGTYNDTWADGATTFTVCAALEDHPTGTNCEATSATCYCQSSALGDSTNQGQQQGCNYFAANQSCKIAGISVDTGQTMPIAPGPIFITCPAQTITCASLTQPTAQMDFYSSAQSTTRIGSMAIIPSSQPGAGPYTISAK